jgi:D-aminopeptidase
MSAHLTSSITVATKSNSESSSISSAVKTNRQEIVDKLMRSYQTDQQLKYLHLQAEIEVLLQQLQSIKQTKLSAK